MLEHLPYSCGLLSGTLPERSPYGSHKEKGRVITVKYTQSLPHYEVIFSK